VAVASAGPYANHLHLAADRQPRQYLTTQFLWAGFPSCHPANSVKALKADILQLKCTKFDFGWGSAPDAAGGAYSTPPDTLAAFKGPTSRRGEGMVEKVREEREGSGGQEHTPVEKSWLCLWRCTTSVVRRDETRLRPRRS